MWPARLRPVFRLGRALAWCSRNCSELHGRSSAKGVAHACLDLALLGRVQIVDPDNPLSLGGITTVRDSFQESLKTVMTRTQSGYTRAQYRKLSSIETMRRSEDSPHLQRPSASCQLTSLQGLGSLKLHLKDSVLVREEFPCSSDGESLHSHIVTSTPSTWACLKVRT